MEMKTTKLVVIGAGLPRTGTKSTHKALQILLKGKCYHIITSLIEEDRHDHIKFWVGLQDGIVPNTPESFRQFFGPRDFVVGVDYPFALYYKTMMEAFPEAKVLLTVREPERWVSSIRETLCQTLDMVGMHYTFFYWIVGRWPWRKMATKVSRPMLEACAKADTNDGLEFYEAWVNEVKRHVPEDRLLVFSVKQGWKPLCDFLDLPVPDEEFPNVNDKKEMQRRLRKVRVIVCVMTAIITASIAGGISYVLTKYNIGNYLQQFYQK